LPAPSFTVAVRVVAAFCAIDGDDGDTVTDVTTGTPVSVVDPLTPSLVAVMVVVPAATTVARPELASSVATPASLELHVTGRFVTVLSFTSMTVAENCCVLPTSTDGAPGATVTLFTGAGDTVTVADPLFPSLVAVAVTVPAARPVTSPVLALMLATPLLAGMLHVTTRSVTTTPRVSLTVAVSRTFAPATTLAAATVTLATGALVTVTVAEPLFPSLVAVAVTEPAERPVTSPVFALMLAYGLFGMVHVTARSVTTTPRVSLTVAVSCALLPTTTLTGATATLATGALATVTVADPLTPSTVAEILAEPRPTAVSAPPKTVTTCVLSLDQIAVLSGSTVPFASSALAARCCVWPVSIEIELGVTITLLTAPGEMVNCEVPLFPSAVAVIVAVPIAFAVTSPFASTVTTSALLVVQTIARPASSFWLASYAFAMSCVLPPMPAFTAFGTTTTLATGAR
jgi:hypothetical protein